MNDFELKLPPEVLEGIPSGHDEMIRYLSTYFDGVIDKYDQRFKMRVTGAFSGPLSRYEKAILKDFLIDATIGRMGLDVARIETPRLGVDGPFANS